MTVGKSKLMTSKEFVFHPSLVPRGYWKVSFKFFKWGLAFQFGFVAILLGWDEVVCFQERR